MLLSKIPSPSIFFSLFTSRTILSPRLSFPADIPLVHRSIKVLPFFFSGMGEELPAEVPCNGHHERSRDGDDNRVLDIYPLSCYYFASKDAAVAGAFRDETPAERVERMKINFAAKGLRTCVEAVMMVELFKHPHLLVLQVKNSTFKLPGGRLRPGESDIKGLNRKLTSKLSADGASDESGWKVGECLGMWWRADFESRLYPYLPPNCSKMPKECVKLFLVTPAMSQKFIVPKNLKLLMVPLCQIHENHKTYGPIIAGVPQLLSKFSFNVVDV